MSAYRLRFGSYDLPQTLRPAGVSGDRDLGQVERPRADGALLQVGRKRARRWRVVGDLTATTPDGLDTLHQELCAALFAGPASLYFGRDDRFVPHAQLESFATDYEEGRLYGSLASYVLTFTAPDPFEVAAQQSVALSTSGTMTPQGNAPALPTWRVLIASTASGSFTLTNTTTGESCTVAGSFTSGDQVDLIRDGYEVAKNSVSAFGLLTGKIPRLVPGSNGYSISSSGISLTSLTCLYYPRWQG